MSPVHWLKGGTVRSIILALLFAVGCGAAASAQTVGGKYSIKGTNPDGSSYGGTAEITPSGDSCRIVWHTDSTWRGICMLANKSFAASYRLGDTYGLVIYELQPDGILKGVWTVADQNGAGTETLIPAK
jgi:hypothetical protein